MKKSTLFNLPLKALLLLLFVAVSFKSSGAAKQQYYEIRIYTISGPAQEKMVDAYLRDAYLPALHRAGIAKAGVFKPVETDTASYGKLVYLFIPFKTMEQYAELPGILEKDKVYSEAGKHLLMPHLTILPISKASEHPPEGISFHAGICCSEFLLLR